jgi:uncharacterized repeat protein (TIGR02543 family)
MPLMRFVVLFSFAALSIARAATCSDFDISANGKSMNAKGNSSVSYSIMIGEALEFTVSPKGDIILWTLSGLIVGDEQSYPPPISVAATGNKAQTMVLRVKNCGIEKTINLNLQVRPYLVTFDPNGGTPTPTPQKVEPGRIATKPTPDPTKTGYSFNRWEMPVGNPYNFSAPVTDSITLKAAWTPNTYTVTYDAQSGTVSPVNKSVTYDAPVGTLPIPTRTGYDFSGWYSAASGGTQYTETTVYKTPNNATLFARWIPKKYTIIFNVDSPDGKVSPPDKSVTYDEKVGTLPVPTRPAHEFKGWFSAPGGSGDKYEATTVYKIPSPTTIYADWEFIKGTTPKVEMLTFTIPSGLVYSGTEITSLPTASQKAGTYGKLGPITILYDGVATKPKNAGTYAISAFIAQDVSGDYASATVLLGSMTIARVPATLTILSATVKSKDYDAKTTAEIDGDVDFRINPLYGSDKYSSSDYSVIANFTSPDVGTEIPVNITISWLPNGPISKNYDIKSSPLTYSAKADIFKATGELRITDPLFDKEPPFYEYTKAGNYAERNPPHAVWRSPFIPDSVKVTFEYKKDGDSDVAYTSLPPNRLGPWVVKASLPGTSNYTSATDTKTFEVIRGNAYKVGHTIEFLIDRIAMDTALSDTSLRSAMSDTLLRCTVADSSCGIRSYYVADSCGIEKATIKITISNGERDIVINLEDDPHYYMNQNCKPDEYSDEDGNCHYYLDGNGWVHREIPFKFDKKPGLYSLIYTLRSASSEYIYQEIDTLLIETPIPFDEKIARTKWNNIIFINNNDSINGGYKFKDFKWFKNGKEVSASQFYSAGPKSTDILNLNDIYKATMHTEEGIRISTCKGSTNELNKTASLPVTEKPAVTKQVLGINGKTTKPEQKVYDIYGVQRKETPAGVYIIKDK